MWRLRAGGRRFLTHSGGLGSPSGLTMELCRSSAAGRGTGERRETVGMTNLRVRAFARKNGPGDRNRHDGASKGVSAASAVRRSGHYAAALYPSRAFRRFISLILEGELRDRHSRAQARAPMARGHLTCSQRSTTSSREDRMHPRLTSINSMLRQQTLAAFRLLPPLTCDAITCMRDSANTTSVAAQNGQTTRTTVCDPRQALRRSRRLGTHRQSRK
jgi:hypothetical protein